MNREEMRISEREREIKEQQDIKKRFLRMIIGGIFGFLFFVTFLLSFEIVSEGNRGLKFTFGKIDNVVLSPGLVFKIPFVQSIEEYTVRPLSVPLLVEVGPQGAITKDNQTIGANITTFYVYKDMDLVNMYSNYGPSKIAELVNTSVYECFKAVIGKYDIFSLALNQNQISGEVLITIKEKLSIYPIRITEVKITNYDWSDDFDAQIAKTMKLAQEVKQKEQELLATVQESQKQVKEAESAREAAIARAEGLKQKTILEAEAKKEEVRLLAEAKYLEGEGIRKYNESIKATLEIQVKLRQLDIDMVKAEKWNGQFVPTNNYGPIPFMNGSIQK